MKNIPDEILWFLFAVFCVVEFCVACGISRGWFEKEAVSVGAADHWPVEGWTRYGHYEFRWRQRVNSSLQSQQFYATGYANGWQAAKNSDRDMPAPTLAPSPMTQEEYEEYLKQRPAE